MSRWNEDDVDIACAAWAWQWVANFGRAPDRAGRYIGPMGFTLGRVRELADGAASSTEHGRSWPEVFLGSGLVVAVVLKTMLFSQREVVWHHYVGRCYDTTTWERLKRPTKQQAIAARLGISLAEYYHRRDTAKACIRTGLTLDTKVLYQARSQVLYSVKLGSPCEPVV